MTFLRQLALAAGLMLLASPVLGQPHENEHEAHAAEHGDDHGDEHVGDAEHGDEHGDEHADHGGHHGHVTFGAIIADDNFLASLFSFGLLVLIIYFGARRKIRAALENRKREIEEAVAEARRREEEAEAKRKEFEERLERLDSEMEKIRDEVVKAGEVERDRIVEEAEAKAALMRKDAKFQIEQQMKQLREDLTSEAIEAAIVAATELLSQKTTADDQRRLADTYLEKLAEMAEEKRA